MLRPTALQLRKARETATKFTTLCATLGCGILFQAGVLKDVLQSLPFCDIFKHKKIRKCSIRQMP